MSLRENSEILAHNSEILSPENLQKAREALAKRWGMALDQIPDDSRILKLFDKSLDDLSGMMKKQDDPMARARILKEKLASIDLAEAASKAQELGKDGVAAVGKLSPEVITQGLTKTTEQLKAGAGEGGKQVLSAVSEIVSADSIDGATGGVNKLSKAITAVSDTVSGAMDGLKKVFAGLMSMLGLDKLWDSLKGGFGMSSSSGEKSPEGSKNTEKGNTSSEVKNLSEVEQNQMYDVAWRNLLVLNTKYSTMVTDTPEAKKAFIKALDKYIAESGITDKKALLEKLRTETASGFSLFRVIKKAQNLDSPELAGEKAKQDQALANFRKNLTDSGVFKMEIMQQQIQRDILAQMESYGWINKENYEDKKRQLEEKFREPKYAALLKEAQETYITQSEEVGVGAFTLGLMTKAPGVLFDLLGTIIPWSAVTTKAVDGVFYFGLRTYTALTSRGFNDALSMMTGVTLDEMGKLPPDKRLLAITILHQQGHLAFALAGMATRVITTAALMPMYWTQGSTLASGKLQFHQMLGEYDKMALTMNHLTKDVLTNGEYSKLTKLSTELRTEMLGAEAKMNLVDIYRNSPNLTKAAIHVEIMKRMNHTGENLDITRQLVQDIVPSTDNTPFTREAITAKFDANQKTGRVSEFLAQMKGLFVVEQENDIKLKLQRSRASLDQMFLNALSEKKYDQWYAKFTSLLGRDMSDFMSNVQKGQIFVNVNGTHPEEQLKALKNVIMEAPSGLQQLFGGLSLVLVVGVAANEDTGHKMETFFQGLKAINPFYATWVFYDEGTKMKGHQWTNPQYLTSMGIAGAFAGVEAASILLNARRIGIFPAIAKSVVDPYKAMVSIPRGGVNAIRAYNAVRLGGVAAAGEHAQERLSLKKGAGRTGLMVLGTTALVALPGAAYAYFDNKKMQAYVSELEKESLIQSNGEVKWEGIANKAKASTQEAKETALKFAATQYIGDNAQNIEIKDSKVDIVLQPSSNPTRALTFGVVSDQEIENLRSVYQKIGYSVNFVYNTDADKLIKLQKDRLLKEGYTQDQIAQLEKQIEWKSSVA